MKKLVVLLTLSALMLTGCVSLDGLFFPNPEPKGKVKAEKLKEKDPDAENTESGTKQKAPGTKAKTKR